jgi:hypothetical protein
MGAEVPYDPLQLTRRQEAPGVDQSTVDVTHILAKLLTSNIECCRRPQRSRYHRRGRIYVHFYLGA